MGYVMNRDVILCLDAGHFHPTETIADKISSILTYKDKLLLHVSRGVRWDSDHVVIFNDDTISIAQEIKRCNAYTVFILPWISLTLNKQDYSLGYRNKSRIESNPILNA